MADAEEVPPEVSPEMMDFLKVQMLYAQNMEAANQLVFQIMNHPQNWETAILVYRLDIKNQMKLDVTTKMLCLQVLQAHCNMYRPKSDQALKSFIRLWFAKEALNSSPEVVKHKMAELMLALFMNQYPEYWPSFFAEISDTAFMGPEAQDMFLRVILYIGEELDNQCSHYSSAVLTHIKDTIRDTGCLYPVFDVMKEILAKACWLEGRNDALIAIRVLKAIRAYISWGSVTLVANDQMFPTIVNAVQCMPVSDYAISCLTKLLQKGMDDQIKCAVVMNIAPIFERCIFNSNPAAWEQNMGLCKNYADLTNAMGLALLSIMRIDPKQSELREDPFMLVMNVVIDTMLALMECNHISICDSVKDFARSYIQYLVFRSNGHGPHTLGAEERQHVITLIEVVIKRLKCKRGHNFVKPGLSEEVFLEFRKSLARLFDDLVVLDCPLVLRAVEDRLNRYVAHAVNDVSVDSNDTEVSLKIFHMFGETLPLQRVNGIVDQRLLESVNVLFLMVIKSKIALHRHDHIVQLFFDVLLRYERFFKNITAETLQDVLQYCIHGLSTGSVGTRQKVQTLLLRTIKSLKEESEPFSMYMLNALETMMVGPFFYNDLDDDQKMMMYEIMCHFILNIPKSNPETPSHHLTNLISPLRNEINNRLLVLAQTKLLTEEVAQNTVKDICSLVRLVTRCTNVFTSHQHVRSVGVHILLEQFMTLFIELVEGLVTSFPIDRGELETSVRNYLHRMVICLDDALLPYMFIIVRAYLVNSDAVRINNFLPLLTQISGKFKIKARVQFLACRDLIFGSVSSSLTGYTETPDSDTAEANLNLRRTFYQFVCGLFGNNLSDLLVNDEVLPFVVKDIIHCIDYVNDPVVKQRVFMFIRKSAIHWLNAEALDSAFQVLLRAFLTHINSNRLFEGFKLTEGWQPVVDEAVLVIQFLHQQNPVYLEENIRSQFLTDFPRGNIERYLEIIRSHTNTRQLKTLLMNFYRVSGNESPAKPPS